MDTLKPKQETNINDSQITTNKPKSQYKKPAVKTHEPLEVISKWNDQSSQLPGI